MKSPANFAILPVYGSATTLNVSLVRRLNDENQHPLLQGGDGLLESTNHQTTEVSVSFSGVKRSGMHAFLVQFKRLQEERWEETEKEFEKDWKIVRNLIPGMGSGRHFSNALVGYFDLPCGYTTHCFL